MNADPIPKTAELGRDSQAGQATPTQLRLRRGWDRDRAVAARTAPTVITDAHRWAAVQTVLTLPRDPTAYAAWGRLHSFVGGSESDRMRSSLSLEVDFDAGDAT